MQTFNNCIQNDYLKIDPCETGYKLQKGNVNNPTQQINDDDSLEIDSAECSVKCNNISRCNSYEHYGKSCKLFATSNVSSKETSGYYNCRRIGELNNFIYNSA